MKFSVLILVTVCNSKIFDKIANLEKRDHWTNQNELENIINHLDSKSCHYSSDKNFSLKENTEKMFINIINL